LGFWGPSEKSLGVLGVGPVWGVRGELGPGFRKIAGESPEVSAKTSRVFSGFSSKTLGGIPRGFERDPNSYRVARFGAKKAHRGGKRGCEPFKLLNRGGRSGDKKLGGV